MRVFCQALSSVWQKTFIIRLIPVKVGPPDALSMLIRVKMHAAMKLPIDGFYASC